MRRKTPSSKSLVAALFLCLLLAPGLSIAASDIYVKFGDIKGEAQAKDHQDWSEALTYSETITMPTSAYVGGGSGAARANFEPIVINKFVDSASAALRQRLSAGTIIGLVEIEFVRGGSQGGEIYLRIELTEALITSAGFSTSVSDDRPVEQIGVSFAKIKWIYTPFDDQGNQGSVQEYGWDVEKNEPF
jgi:type VI secretion system secreted protein Hcp